MKKEDALVKVEAKEISIKVGKFEFHSPDGIASNCSLEIDGKDISGYVRRIEIIVEALEPIEIKLQMNAVGLGEIE